MNFAFVVLHYNDFEETKTCVDSINEYYKNNPIILIDNGSSNNSILKLEKLYLNNHNITIIKLTKNLGYSIGNNIGCEFAIATYDPDFLIVCNNDIEFVDKDMLVKIEQIYKIQNFGVLGPDIFLPYLKEHQSPFRTGWANTKTIEKEIEYYKRRMRFLPFMNFYHSSQNRLNSFILKIEYNILRIKAFYQQNKVHYKNKQENVGLYGACLIFSKQYFENFTKIFYPETFLYCEEDILLYNCIKKDILVLYDPQILVKHNRKISTNPKNDWYEQEIKRITNLIESRYIYLNYIKLDKPS